VFSSGSLPDPTLRELSSAPVCGDAPGRPGRRHYDTPWRANSWAISVVSATEATASSGLAIAFRGACDDLRGQSGKGLRRGQPCGQPMRSSPQQCRQHLPIPRSARCGVPVAGTACCCRQASKDGSPQVKPLTSCRLGSRCSECKSI
jgi:hypothetical protein